MSKAKAMGTAVESAAVLWLREHGFSAAERLALAGAADRGDIRLRVAPTIIAECKRAQRGVQLTPWMREVEVETVNAMAAYGLLVAKQRGVGDKNVARWFAAMTYDSFVKLWVLAGGIFDDNAATTWSPTRINSTYVPLLTDKALRNKAYPSGWAPAPFAITYAPGHPEYRTVCGALERFIDLFRRAGFGEE